MSYLPITCILVVYCLIANILSCITHQLNINKCITKQYHEMTIEYLSFIRFVGRFLLDPSASSSSSFMTSSFLIQMLRWIRGSSYSSSLEGSSLNRECLILSCSHILFSYYESSCFLCKALSSSPSITRTSPLM